MSTPNQAVDPAVLVLAFPSPPAAPSTLSTQQPQPPPPSLSSLHPLQSSATQAPAQGQPPQPQRQPDTRPHVHPSSVLTQPPHEHQHQQLPSPQPQPPPPPPPTSQSQPQSTTSFTPPNARPLPFQVQPLPPRSSLPTLSSHPQSGSNLSNLANPSSSSSTSTDHTSAPTTSSSSLASASSFLNDNVVRLQQQKQEQQRFESNPFYRPPPYNQIFSVPVSTPLQPAQSLDPSGQVLPTSSTSLISSRPNENHGGVSGGSNSQYTPVNPTAGVTNATVSRDGGPNGGSIGADGLRDNLVTRPRTAEVSSTGGENSNPPEIFKATYSGVPVFEMICKGVAVMRRRSDSYLNATQILKVADFDKPQRTRILEREIQKGQHEKVQGGYGKYQGTWVPYTRGVQLCDEYNVRQLLQPLLEYQISKMSPRLAPKHVTAASNRPRKPKEARIPGTPKIKKIKMIKAAQILPKPGPFGPVMGAMEGPGGRSMSTIFDGEVYDESGSDQDEDGDGQSVAGSDASMDETMSILSARSRTPSPLDSRLSSEISEGETQSTGQRRRRRTGSMDRSPQSRKKQYVRLGDELFVGYSRNHSRASSPTQRSSKQDRRPTQMQRNGHDEGLEMNQERHQRPFNSTSRYASPHQRRVAPSDSRGAAAEDGATWQESRSSHPEISWGQYAETLLEYFVSDSNSLPRILTHPPPDLDFDLIIDEEGHTPLHWAVAMARTKIVRLLVQHGADIYRVNNQGQTALMRSVLFTNNFDLKTFPSLLEILQKTIFTIDKNDQTVFHHVAITAGMRGKVHAARYYMESLLDKLAQHPNELASIINVQDVVGDTALMIAARIGNKKVVLLLMEAGADSRIRNRSGRNAEEYLQDIDIVLPPSNTATPPSLPLPPSIGKPQHPHPHPHPPSHPQQQAPPYPLPAYPPHHPANHPTNQHMSYPVHQPHPHPGGYPHPAPGPYRHPSGHSSHLPSHGPSLIQDRERERMQGGYHGPSSSSNRHPFQNQPPSAVAPLYPPHLRDNTIRSSPRLDTHPTYGNLPADSPFHGHGRSAEGGGRPSLSLQGGPLHGRSSTSKMIPAVTELFEQLAQTYEKDLHEKEQDLLEARSLLHGIQAEIDEGRQTIEELRTRTAQLNQVEEQIRTLEGLIRQEINTRQRLQLEDLVIHEEAKLTRDREKEKQEQAATGAGAGAGPDMTRCLALEKEAAEMRLQLAQLQKGRREQVEQMVQLKSQQGKRRNEYKRLIALCCNVSIDEVEPLLEPLLNTLGNDDKVL